MEKILLTAGGRIKCLRCTAKSSSTKQQCGRDVWVVVALQNL